MIDKAELRTAHAQDPYYPAVTEQGEDGLNPKAILAFLRRRRNIILGVTLLGTAAAAFFGYTREPTYTAQTFVMIEPRDARVVDVQAVMAGLSTDAATIETQVKLITSRALLEQVADRLNLVDPNAPLQPAANGVVGKFAQAVYNLIPSNLLFATGLAQEQPHVPPDIAVEFARAAKAEDLSKNLRVKQEGRSLVLSINYTSRNPHEAAAIANGLADLYIENQVGDKTRATKRATDWLEIRLAELQEQLIASDTAVEEYRSKNQLFENRGVSMQSQQIMNLTNMLVQARAERSEKESRLRYIRDLQGRRESLNTLSEVMNSPYMGKLWEQERAIQQAEVDLLNTYGDKHPKVLSLKAEKAKIAEKINAEVQRIVDNVGNEIKVLGAREKSIESDIARLVDQTDKAGVSEIKLRELERQASANRALYESFLQRYKETKEQQQLAEANAKVVARANPPEKPSSRGPQFFVLVGFLVSSMLGTGLAWLVERLDSTIRSGKEIERLFGLPCLGLVPYLGQNVTKKHGGVHGYLVAKPLSIYAETMRAIFTSLRLSNVDDPPRVIQVTSSVPAEGKTTLAISLAASLSQHGQKVILVDLDIRHPSVGRELGTKEHGRLVEYMVGDIDLEDAVYRHEACRIDVISVGRQSVSPGAIISSETMRQLIARLRASYDYVILDSTPVLGVTDSKLTAELADTTVFVVRWEKTTRDIAEDALKDLIDSRGRIGGVVITQVNVHKHARYGYGGVDHYYSKYHKYYTN